MRSGKIKIIGKSAIDFLIAPKANCIACTSALGANESFLCPNCYAALSPLYQTFEGVKKICRLCGREISGLRCRCGGGPKGAYETFSAYHFEMPVSALVKSFKYKAVTNLSGWLAEEMIKALKGEKEFDLITCVPMHPLRRIKRGFNQSEILAKIISKKLNIPYVSVLKRRRYTKRQATLSAVKRRENLKHAFEATGTDIKNQRILLVDDVRTTGTTIISVANQLMESGAKKVSALTFACAKEKKS